MYVLILIGSAVLGAVNNVWLMKKYQLAVGTGLYANAVFLLINGAVSVLLGAAALLARGEKLSVTPYSLLMATVIVISASISTISILRGYETGQIAVVNIVSAMGTVLMSCVFGLLFLGESISLRQAAAILMILAAIPLFAWKCPESRGFAEGNVKEHQASGEGGGRENPHILLYVIIFLSTGFVNILSRIHQTETEYPAVDTISFSFWIGVIRAGMTAVCLLFLRKRKKQRPAMSRRSYAYAAGTSVVTGTCYLLTLIATAVLPLTITTPLSMGISMGLTSFLPWLFYREQLSRQKIGGIMLSMFGILLYA